MERRPLPAPTLILSAGLALGTALGFAAVGFLVGQRQPRTQSWLASISFAAFWHSAAIVAGSQGLRILLASLELDTFALIVALEQVSTPFYVLAAASLTYYVLFLLTGRGSFATPVAIYFLSLYPALRFHVARAHPIGYVVTDWQVNYVYVQPLQWWGYTLTLALLTLPVLASVVAYATLARHTDRATRYRIACVTLGLALWVGIEAATFASGLAATTTGEILRRSLGLAAASVVIVGYLPPAWVQRRWGARTVDATS